MQLIKARVLMFHTKYHANMDYANIKCVGSAVEIWPFSFNATLTSDMKLECPKTNIVSNVVIVAMQKSMYQHIELHHSTSETAMLCKYPPFISMNYSAVPCLHVKHCSKRPLFIIKNTSNRLWCFLYKSCLFPFITSLNPHFSVWSKCKIHLCHTKWL